MTSQPSDAKFDPYYKWLGIPADIRPINHYQLLGLQVFENDPEVIAVAADRQMAHIKTFSAGQYSQQSQQLLDELARARIALLNPREKQKYDSELRSDLADRVVPQETPLDHREQATDSLGGLTIPSELENSDSDGFQAEQPLPVRVDDSNGAPSPKPPRRKPPMFAWSVTICLFTAIFFLVLFVATSPSPSNLQECFVSIRLDGVAAEGGPPPILIVEQSRPLESDASITLSLEGTLSAERDIDFPEEISGSNGRPSFVMPAGTRVLEVPVRIVDDEEVEKQETATVRIVECSSGETTIPMAAVANKLLLRVDDNDEAVVSLLRPGEREVVGSQLPEVTLRCSAPIPEKAKVQYSWTVISESLSAGTHHTATGKDSFVIPSGHSRSLQPLSGLVGLSKLDHAEVVVRLDSVSTPTTTASIDPRARETKLRWRRRSTRPTRRPDSKQADKQPELLKDNDPRLLRKVTELVDEKSPLGRVLACTTVEQLEDVLAELDHQELERASYLLVQDLSELTPPAREVVAKLQEAYRDATKRKQEQEQQVKTAISESLKLLSKESIDQTIRELKKLQKRYPQEREIGLLMGLCEAGFGCMREYDAKHLKSSRVAFAHYIAKLENDDPAPLSLEVLNLQGALNNHAVVSAHLKDYRNAYKSWQKAIALGPINSDIFQNFELFARRLQDLELSSSKVLTSQVMQLSSQLRETYESLPQAVGEDFSFMRPVHSAVDSMRGSTRSLVRNSREIQSGRPIREGWGIAVSKEHLITHRSLATNAHSILVRAQMLGGKDLFADWIRVDGELALLRVRELGAKPLPLANSYPRLHDALWTVEGEVAGQAKASTVSGSFVGVVDASMTGFAWPNRELIVFRSSSPLSSHGYSVVNPWTSEVVGLVHPMEGFRDDYGVAVSSAAIREFLTRRGIKTSQVKSNSESREVLLEQVSKSTFRLEARVHPQRDLWPELVQLGL